MKNSPPFIDSLGRGNDAQLGTAIAVLIGVIFLFDIITPLSLVVWTLYLLPLFLTIYVRQRFAPLYVACTAVLLSLAGIFLSVPDVPIMNALINRVFFSAVIAVVALFIWNYREGATALTRRTEELHRSTALLTNHVENSPIAIIEFDARFRITRWTGEATRIFGWAPEDVMGKAIGEFPWVYEEDVPRVTSISADMLEGRSPSNMHANRNYRKDGTVIECEWYNSALRDGDGNLISIFSQVLDVTARNRAEAELGEKNESLHALNEELTAAQEELRQNLDELAGSERALQESEERFRTIAEISPAQLSIAGLSDGVILFTNPAYDRGFGYAPGELAGRRISDLYYDPADRERIMGIFIKEGATDDHEVRTKRKDGTLSWVNVSLRPIRYLGLDAVLAASMDISGRKRVEAEADLMREILRALNAGGELHPMTREILRIIRDATGFDAVGLRLRMGDEFPYFEQNGFPGEFQREEDFLCARHGDGSITRNADGSAVLECTCGLILSGKTDPSMPCFTSRGSFWTCRSPGPIRLAAEGDPRVNPHNRCSHDGYRSVALIPVRSGSAIIGMLQLNDRREGQFFHPDRVRFFETVADNIGLAIRRGQADEEVKSRNAELAAANEELTATDEELRQNIDELGKKEEELSAKNEELNAAQEELQQTVEELGRNEEILKRNEAELMESLQEKEILLSEIHHRVKNNLSAFISLLSLKGTYQDTPEGHALRLDLQNRARSMALIHETLYRTKKFSQVDMGVYISTLVNQIAASFPSQKPVDTGVSAAGVTLDITRATPCGLIINELMTNALKHAFPESAVCGTPGSEPCIFHVAFTRSDGYYTLSVSDNGIGLPSSVDIRTAKSLGLRLVYFLAKHQLQATVDVDVTGGTRFIIRFRE